MTYNPTRIQKVLHEFIAYLEVVKEKELDPIIQRNAQNAIEGLKEFLIQIEDNSFGHDQAYNLAGFLSKGIEDWIWKPEQDAQIRIFADRLWQEYGELLKDAEK